VRKYNTIQLVVSTGWKALCKVCNTTVCRWQKWQNIKINLDQITKNTREIPGIETFKLLQLLCFSCQAVFCQKLSFHILLLTDTMTSMFFTSYNVSQWISGGINIIYRHNFSNLSLNKQFASRWISLIDHQYSNNTVE